MAGLIVGGVGIVGVGVGAFFGLKAKSSLDDSNADNHCRDSNRCDAIGVQARSDAASFILRTFRMGGRSRACVSSIHFAEHRTGRGLAIR